MMNQNIYSSKNDVDEAELLQEALSSGAWNVEFNQKAEITSVYWSPVFRRMIGYTDESDFPNNIDVFIKILHFEDRDRVITHYWEAVRDYTNHSPYDTIYRLLTKNHGYRWFHAAGRFARRVDGSPISFVGFFIDIDEKIKAEEALRLTNQARAEQLHILQSLAQMYFSMHLINLKDGSTKEYSAGDILRPYLDLEVDVCEKMRLIMKNLVVPLHQSNAIEFTDLTTISKRMKGLKTLSSEFLGVYTGWFLANFISVEADSEGYPTLVLFTTQIIDETKHKEQVLFLRSMTDEMTGFFNRRAYEERLDFYRKNPIEDDLVFISFDINRLKYVNDHFGHAAGDELIRGFADLLRGMRLKYGDRAKIYRIGGDEFVGLMHLSPSSYKQAVKVFDEMVRQWEGKLVKELSISYGAAFRCQCQELSIDEMAKLADKLMYKNKEQYYKKAKIDRRAY